MRKILAVILLMLAGAALATSPDYSAAIASLNADAKTPIVWNTRKAQRADVTCDGKLDTIMFGKAGKSIWVGVVSGGSGKAQTMEFGFGAGDQGSFCGVPRKILFYSINCNSEEGVLPGCKPIKGCKEFSVDDEDCDPFNFYWDSSRKSLSWWRN